MKPKHELIAPWLMEAFTDRPQRIAALVSHITRFRETNYVGGIACCGISGMAMAFAVGDLLNLPVCVVRKEADSHHSTGFVEGLEFDDYIIIDDFVQTGKTVGHIIDRMRRDRLATNPLAIFCYHASEHQDVAWTDGNRHSLMAWCARYDLAKDDDWKYPVVVCDDTDGDGPIVDAFKEVAESYGRGVQYW